MEGGVTLGSASSRNCTDRPSPAEISSSNRAAAAVLSLGTHRSLHGNTAEPSSRTNAPCSVHECFWHAKDSIRLAAGSPRKACFRSLTSSHLEKCHGSTCTPTSPTCCTGMRAARIPSPHGDAPQLNLAPLA